MTATSRDLSQHGPAVVTTMAPSVVTVPETSVPAVKSPRVLFVCLLVYVGLLYIRPSEIVTDWRQIPFVNIAAIVSLVVAVLSFMFAPRSFVNLPNDRFVLAFWVVIFASNVAWWVAGAYEGFMEFLPVIFGYFLIRMAVRKPSQLKALVYWLVILTMFQAVNGIVEAYTGVGVGGVTPILDRIRGTGIFNDPNDLALTMVMVLPFVLTMVVGRGSRLRTRALGALMLGVLLFAIFLTNSRGGILGLATTVLFYSFRRFKRTTAIVAGVLALTALIVAAPARMGEMSATEESAQSRIQAWADGWTMLKSNPALGVGYGRFTDFHPRVAHNSFVHTMAELGFVGAICLVGMFYSYFTGLRAYKSADPLLFPNAQRWALDLTASAVGMVTSCWFLSRQYVAYIYIVLALGAAFTAMLDRKRYKLDAADAIRIVVLTLLLMIAVNISIRTMAVWTGGS